MSHKAQVELTKKKKAEAKDKTGKTSKKPKKGKKNKKAKKGMCTDKKGKKARKAEQGKGECAGQQTRVGAEACEGDWALVSENGGTTKPSLRSTKRVTGKRNQDQVGPWKRIHVTNNRQCLYKEVKYTTTMLKKLCVSTQSRMSGRCNQINSTASNDN